MNKTALTLIIVGALNWLLVGIFQFDLVAAIFGGQAGAFSRIIYVIIGIAGIWAFAFWNRVGVRDRDVNREGYHNRKEAYNYEFGKDYSTRDNDSSKKDD
jgi:uncharacterized protein